MHIETAHRLWPVPDRPWAMFMRWHELLFMHWPIDVALLRPLIPPTLEIDTFDGDAWLGIVPFRMSGTRPRCLPAVPMLSNFPELNVRTYVTAGGRPGVWFFSLDAASAVAVRVARYSYSLNYYDARMACSRDPRSETITYRSRRTHRGAAPAEFVARYRPTGAVDHSSAGSLEHFLTERYCLYAAAPDGRTYRGDIAHARWPLQPAEAEVELNTMTAQLGFQLPAQRPLLHYARQLDVVAWKPQRLHA